MSTTPRWRTAVLLAVPIAVLLSPADPQAALAGFDGADLGFGDVGFPVS
ncbi:hypothetical protein ACIOJE_34825 [Kitasatospora sp. NPDC087861]